MTSDLDLTLSPFAVKNSLEPGINPFFVYSSACQNDAYWSSGSVNGKTSVFADSGSFRKLNKSYVELKNQEAAAEEEVLFPVMVLSEGCNFFVPVEPAALYFLPRYSVFLNFRKVFFSVVELYGIIAF